MKKSSVILLGSKPGAVAALTILLELGWDVRYVVVSQQHEYDWIPKPSLREFAQSKNLSILQSQDELPNDTKVDFVISYMCRDRVKPRTLNMAIRAPLNFHAGPLPEFGGWAFYNVAILENATEYGCTCHYMDEGFDTGPLLKVSKFNIDPVQETALSLETKAQNQMIKLFVEFCELAESGTSLPVSDQDPARMRYMTHEEFKELKEIPLDADPEEIDRRARAFWYPPYECAYLVIGGERIEVVPELAKEHMAKQLHASDLLNLLDSAEINSSLSEVET